MKLELSKSEINILIELLCLGNWIANSTKLKDKRIENYEEVFSKSVRQILQADFDEESLHDKLSDVIENYDNSIFFSEFAKIYANYKFPIDQDELIKGTDEAIMQYAGNSATKTACENELQVNGFKSVSVNLPDITDKIKKKFNSMKNRL